MFGSLWVKHKFTFGSSLGSSMWVECQFVVFSPWCDWFMIVFGFDSIVVTSDSDHTDLHSPSESFLRHNNSYSFYFKMFKFVTMTDPNQTEAPATSPLVLLYSNFLPGEGRDAEPVSRGLRWRHRERERETARVAVLLCDVTVALQSSDLWGLRRHVGRRRRRGGEASLQ